MSLEKRQSMEMEPESPVVEREVAGAQKDEDEEEVEIKLEAQKPPPYGARHGKVRQQPQVDAELVKQFLARYSQQDEHDPNDPEVHNGVVGTLNVPDCLAMIEANDVTFIVTDTGTGKSTLIPKALLEKGAIVASSQPRRTAAINLAHRVASLRNEKVGEAVGYRVRGEHAGDEKTCHLMYMTSYTLLLYVLSHPADLAFTHFLIDEFHERQPDVEVMLALLRVAKLQPNPLPFKIVLLSASVEVELWKSYFTGLKVDVYSTCKPKYAIHDYYAEELCRMVGAHHNRSPPHDIVSSLALQNTMFLVREMLKFLAKHASPAHSILVFLPGRSMVESTAKWVSKCLSDQMEPIQWYRDVELSSIHAALQRRPTNKKKVYLATDIAEVSVTLPDVVFVVDSGTTKKPRIDVRNRNSVVFPPLELIWCSRSNVQQRRGRVGRVQQGFYFSMIAEEHLPLLREMEPQIANQRINELSLHTLEVAPNPTAVFNLCRVTPKIESVNLSLEYLIDDGCVLLASDPHASTEALDSSEAVPWRNTIMQNPINAELRGATYVTTFRGKVSQHLPLSLECSSIVFFGVQMGLESIMVLAASIVDSGSPFYAPMEESKRDPELVKAVGKEMARHSHGLPSDIIASLDVLIAYKCDVVQPVLSEAAEEEWCNERQVSRTRIQSILALEQQTKLQLSEQVSFRDVDDPKALQNLLNHHARTIHLLVAASHLERALFIQNDPAQAQVQGTVGPCIFLGIDAICDQAAPTCVVWERNEVVIPLVTQVRYGRLLGAFASRLTQKEFNLLLVLFSSTLYLQRRATEKLMYFGLEQHHKRLMMKCDAPTGFTILDFRSRLSGALRTARVMADHHILADQEYEVDRLVTEAEAAHHLSCANLAAPHCRAAECFSGLSQLFSQQVFDTLDCTPVKDDSFDPNEISQILTYAPVTEKYTAPPAPPRPPSPQLAHPNARPPNDGNQSRMPKNAPPVSVRVGTSPPQLQMQQAQQIAMTHPALVATRTQQGVSAQVLQPPMRSQAAQPQVVLPPQMICVMVPPVQNATSKSLVMPISPQEPAAPVAQLRQEPAAVSQAPRPDGGRQVLPGLFILPRDQEAPMSGAPRPVQQPPGEAVPAVVFGAPAALGTDNVWGNTSGPTWADVLGHKPSPVTTSPPQQQAYTVPPPPKQRRANPVPLVSPPLEVLLRQQQGQAPSEASGQGRPQFTLQQPPKQAGRAPVLPPQGL